MQKLIHWGGQYLLAAGTMFALLVCIDVFLRGEAFATVWPMSLAWSLMAAGIFIASRYFRSNSGALPPGRR
ncbi:hypothetical protein LK542_07840 [Massilia sp. IC2-477]|uniref:hypothetical protein n=1 Tax=unclassified Massilia TaxID=2609279 RepID=UPI001D109C92|nr:MULTISPECIES: hypothetical protein [unclassified Massilia]MCC2955522.1 hypothetical protein [Massilia sp. IC2-477]MCC2974452.1 hypothetical protein [Massilia sp. IC2-476]